MNPSEREEAVIELLDAWPWERGGVVIGGYAVAAYGAPRYSDDLDILIPTSALEPAIEWMTSEGFEEIQVPPDLIQNYAGKIGRWARDGVTVDLIPGVVRDREALVDIPEHWLSKDPIRERLILIEGSTRSPIPVVRMAAFWAMKLQAGRPRDLGDLLSTEPTRDDLAEVQALYRDLWCDTLESKLRKVHASLDVEKTYADVLSQRQMGSPNLPRNKGAWDRLRRNVARCLPG